MTAARLRRAGDRQSAVVRLRQARDHLAALGARPYVAACERELAHVRGRDTARAAAGLEPDRIRAGRGPPGQHRPVQPGSVGELYVSVKAVEFHLGHVFDKIGIRSRRALPGRQAAAR